MRAIGIIDVLGSSSVRVRYRSLFSRELAQASVQQYQVKLIVYDPNNEVIVQWQE